MIRCTEPGCGMYVRSKSSLGGHYMHHHSDPGRIRLRPVRQPTHAMAQAVPGDWAEHAACKGKTDLMFGQPDDTPLQMIVRARQAKAICATCPVTRPCLQFALDHNERHGVWGGLGPTERRHHIKRRVS